ncbi:glucose-6-phosphate isomerase [Nocardioides daphniae]|uniref:Glucose-6-phosphate isomerase n=1 Tax=Nocardioides daphniae TaxID=402297 RepID=A0A4V1CWH2_9ACTN|nr:glucose-6-phosphate isomerase [Nocardioides daphniae]QCC77257.1 glucose-6-phosphate isomerase [Nocardioides daphniae]GGD26135.1 glucose-6-phosphate isomerase [Nocardioides daphniae]
MSPAGPVQVVAGDSAAYDAAMHDLVQDKVASRLFARDHTLWGAAAESEAAQRLGWIDLPRTSRALLESIIERRDTLRAEGVDRIVLCGMGGSSLAPEVICADAGVELVVLDSSHPDAVRDVIDTDLARTAVVIASKSGGTVETDSQRRAYEQAFVEADIDPASRMVVVTDPDSPLDEFATGRGWTVFRADPEVGGRYSALSAFGLVPSGLAGVELQTLLDDASALVPALQEDSPANPALQLGAVMAVAARQGVDKMVLGDTREPSVGFAAWVEQLVAESTGKNGTGILPIDVGSTTAPNFTPASQDTVLVSCGPASDLPDAPSGWSAHVDAAMGAQMLVWEVATAVAGRLLGINPFDQPDVESAKAAAREMLDGSTETWAPDFVDGDVQVFTAGDWLPDGISTVAEAVRALLARLDQKSGYLAVQAYLDRDRDEVVTGLRTALAERTSRPVSFGWAPRFLHSTGQYHKGGPAQGVFLQVTGAQTQDLAVPDRPFTFGEFIEAQAAGDAHVLGSRGRPVLRLHVGRPEALAALREDVG